MNYLVNFSNGFLMGGSIIVAIGAQNAFVLQQGILKNRIFTVCFICFFCDTLLIILGGLGFSYFISQNKAILIFFSYGGAFYLILYGLIKLFSVFGKNEALSISLNQKKSINSVSLTVFNTLSVTLFNPHVYLDTVILIGSIVSKFQNNAKYFFLLGAIIASGLWFFSLGYGGKLFSPFLKKPKSWKVINFLIAIIMFYIAINILKMIRNF